MKKITLSIKKMTRKQWIIIAIAGVLLLLIAGVVWQEYAWRSYVDRNNEMTQQASSSAQEQLLSVKSPESLETLSSWLSRVSSESCDAPTFTDIRMALSGAAQQYQDDCRSYQARMQTASQAADSLQRHLQSSQDIAGVMDDAAKRLKTINAAKYAERERVWVETRSSLEALQGSDSVKSLKAAQVEAINQITASYQDLITADKAKKRSQFDDATKKLTRAYGALKDTAEQAKDVYTPIAQRLIDSVAAL